MTATYTIRKIVSVSTRKSDGVTTFLKAVVAIDGRDEAVSLRAGDIAAYDPDAGTVTVTAEYLATRTRQAENVAAFRAATVECGEEARAALLAHVDVQAAEETFPAAYVEEVRALIRGMSAAECEVGLGGVAAQRALRAIRVRHGLGT